MSYPDYVLSPEFTDAVRACLTPGGINALRGRLGFSAHALSVKITVRKSDGTVIDVGKVMGVSWLDDDTQGPE